MPPAVAASGAQAERFRAETRRGRPGFFHVAQNTAGQWWLLEPGGRPTWCRAVHGVQAEAITGDAALPRDASARLRGWGFTALGIGGDGGARDDGLPYLGLVDFCAAGPVIAGPGLRLPDVFDPQWPARAIAHARQACAALADEPRVIGWVTDDAPGWAQPAAGRRPSLLQLCLSLEPVHAAYHAAWEFALALHGGRLEALARAWATPLANKGVVRELTRAEQPIGTRGYWRDEARWTRELARRYFRTTTDAIRAADPNHLVLGCRFGDLVGPQVLGEGAPVVDVAMPD